MNKFLLLLFCILLLLTAVACAPSAREPEKIYEDIIEQYTELLTAKHNGEVLTEPRTDGMNERDAAIVEVLYNVVDSCKDAEAAEALGYGFKDMDCNGISELILMTQYTGIRAIFTVSGKKPILLAPSDGEDDYLMFAPKNRFLMTKNTVDGKLEQVIHYTCRVDGDKVAYDAVYGAVYDREKREYLERFRVEDGEKVLIDKDTFNALYREQNQANQPGYSRVSKLVAPRIHFPLRSGVSDEDLPLADFSSYAAIRETYTAISARSDDFNLSAWGMGEYDELFAFQKDIDFEYYIRLLYIASAGSPMGYDEIDLNGDGQDELILLNEDYNIKAIFTQKKGIPVLIDLFTTAVCWLDDQGFIHVDSSNYGYTELEYSLYEFTKDGEYNLVYSILAAESGRYLTKNGKTEQISFEESLTLYYDDYCRYAEPFEPYEQTRNVSSLRYTPLIGPEADPVMSGVAKSWHKYAKLEKTTGKDFARSNTYITFEEGTGTPSVMNLQYQFTYSYPDPDRDHYLLDDTTESFLAIPVRESNGAFVFDEAGIRGRVEFGYEYLWIIIEESTDSRFPAGSHCYEVYNSQ